MAYEKFTYSSGGGSVEFSKMSVFHLNEVSGASDSNVTLLTADEFGQDGTTVLGSRADAREIEIRGSIKAVDLSAVIARRRELQKMFRPHVMGVLEYSVVPTVDFLQRGIKCYPIHAPIFTRNGVFTDFTITLFCPYPYWNGNGGGAAFAGSPQSCAVDNDGDVPCGFYAEFLASSTVVNPTLSRLYTDEKIKVNATIPNNSYFCVQTYPGDKRVYADGNSETDLLGKLTADSKFFKLVVGTTYLRITCDSGTFITGRIWFTKLHSGV